MNTKINKIMSVLAIVAIVASSFVWALPVAASNPGDGTFTVQDIPQGGTAGKNVLLTGSAIIDIAVASDGKTIYVASSVNTALNPFNYLFKSTDAGQSFDLILNNYITAAGGGVPVAISIAPDDVNTLAVADVAGKVIITKDGGTTWSALPNPTIGANGVVTDIAVAPARSGTLLGREYIVSIADGTAGVGVLGNGGDVQIIGNNAGWATIGGVAPSPNTIAGVFDFTSVVVTPNFLGDRCVVAVGTKGVGTTTLLVINTATNTIVNNAGAGVVLFAGTTTDYQVAAVPASISSSSIALPSNYDATTSSGRRCYVGIAAKGPAIQADNDVYKVENDGSKALGAITGPVYSVAYFGTVDAGTLFMGPRNNVDVKYTTQMTGTSPTWTTTLKGPSTDPTVTQPSVLLRIASDYATSSMLFAGTLGLETGFNVSSDAGVSFIQESLIDTGNTAGVANIGKPSLSFASDGKSCLVSARDPHGFIALWRTDVPFTTTSWKRIFTKAGTAISTKTSGTAIYVADIVVAPATQTPIYVSQDNGVYFSTRNGPSSLLTGYEIRDAQTVYGYDAAGNIYKSTNAAFFWNTPVATGAGAINAISLSKANQIIAAGTTVTISNDDGATFTAINGGLTAGAAYTVAPDGAYATNNVLYAADTGTAGTNVFRVKTDSTSNIWENLNAPITATSKIKGIGLRSGALYVTTDAAVDGIIRTLYPTDLVGNQNWVKLSVAGLAPDASVSRTGAVNLYQRVIVTVGGPASIYAFNDLLGGTKPTLTTPEDNYADNVNPSGGNGYPVDLKWKPMGTGNGQVDRVDIEIVDKSNGFTGVPTWPLQVIAPTNPVITVSGPTAAPGSAFQPNKVYQWRVRAARTTSGQLIDSPWSDPRTINIQAGGIVSQVNAGVVLQGPTGGAQGLDPASVGFSWAQVSGATEYQIIVATDAGLTKTVSGTPATVTIPAYQATGLTYSTVYYWAVKATKPTASIQSVGTFTTMAKPVVQPTGAATNPTQTVIVQNPTAGETPVYIWAVIAIGAILVIAVIILIVRTRRVP